MFGIFIMAAFLCVNLASCSDDDDDDNKGGGGGATGLEGTWGLTKSQGWEIYDGEKQEWNVSFNPNNPVGEELKMVVTKTGDKTYLVKWYDFNDGEWQYDEGDDDRVKVEGNVITYIDDPDEKVTFSLNNNQLVIISEEEDFYSKDTFIRM